MSLAINDHVPPRYPSSSQSGSSSSQQGSSHPTVLFQSGNDYPGTHSNQDGDQTESDEGGDEDEDRPGDQEISSDSEDDSGAGDTEYIQQQSDTDAGPYYITPPRRAIGSDGKGKRDPNTKLRVKEILEELNLETSRCSLTNAYFNGVKLQQAHLLPVSAGQDVVRFLKYSIAVTV